MPYSLDPDETDPPPPVRACLGRGEDREKLRTANPRIQVDRPVKLNPVVLIVDALALHGALKNVSQQERANPQPESRKPKAETRTPKPETRNLKPDTRNLKPETRNAAGDLDAEPPRLFLAPHSVRISMETYEIICV